MCCWSQNSGDHIDGAIMVGDAAGFAERINSLSKPLIGHVSGHRCTQVRHKSASVENEPELPDGHLEKTAQLPAALLAD